MNTQMLINIVAALMAIAGMTYQLYSDTRGLDNNYGMMMVILALGISIVNELLKSRNK